MKRSADPLTAATTAILRPAIRPDGFDLLSRRSFARVRAGILHFIDLQLSTWGGKMFCVNYAAISLYSPRDHFVLEPGDRLRKESGGEKWWPADNHDSANNSAFEVVKALKAQALPFFDRAQTTAGYLEIMERKKGGSFHHLLFERACVYARLELNGAAKEALAAAIRLYGEDGRSWCAACIVRCEELLAAIERGRVEALLTQWTDKSIGSLRLEKFLEKMSPENVTR